MLKRVLDSLDGLSDALERQGRLRSEVAGGRENVSIARFDVLAAQRALATAQAQAGASPAEEGSVEQVALANRITAAELKLTEANKALTAAERQRDVVEEQLRRNQQSRQFVIANTTKALKEQIAATARQPRIVTATRFNIPIGIRVLRREFSDTTALKNFNKLMDDLIEKGGPLQQKVAGALRTVSEQFGRVPTEKQIEIAVRMTGLGVNTNKIVGRLLGIEGLGEVTGEDVRLRGLRTVQPGQAAEDAFLAAKARLKAEQETLKTLREENSQLQSAAATARASAAAARDAVVNARESLAESVRGLADAQRALRDTQASLLETIVAAHRAVQQAIRDSAQSVNDAVLSAKQNLDSLGQSVAEALGKFSGGSATLTTKMGARFRALRDEILAGGGGPETVKAQQQIAFEINAQRGGDTKDVTQDFADLTDAVNRGKISLPQFNRELSKLLKGLNIGKFRQEFGTAATNVLQEQIRALRRQAALVLGGPQRQGGAQQQALVRPLEAVAAGAKAIAAARSQAAKDIAGAQRDMADAARGVTRAQRDIIRNERDLAAAERRLRTAESKERKANTAALRAHTKVTKQLKDVEAALLRKNVKPKEKGQGDGDKKTTAGNTKGDRKQ